MGVLSKVGAKLVSKKTAKQLAAEAARARKLKENQKKPINELQGMTSAEKKAADIGEASPARTMMGEAGKKRSESLSRWEPAFQRACSWSARLERAKH